MPAAKRKNSVPAIEAPRHNKRGKANTGKKVPKTDKKAEIVVAKKEVMKKAPKVDPVEQKLNTIRDAIELRNTTGGDTVTQLIMAVLKPALSDLVEDRHDMLKRTCQMVEEVLNNIAASLKATTKEKTDLIDNADLVRENFQKELDEMVAGITQKEEEITNFEETLTADEATFEECTDKKNSLSCELDELKAEGETNQASFTNAQDGLDNLFKAMIAEAPGQDKAGKKKMGELTNLLKKIDCDGSLLNAVPSALFRQAETRGHFDKLAISSLEQHFAGFLEKLKTSMDTQDEREATKMTQISAATTTEEEAKQKAIDSSDTLSTAKAALATAKKAKKAKEAEMKAHDNSVDAAEVEKTVAEEEETEFKEVMDTFFELKNRTEIVEEEETVETGPGEVFEDASGEGELFEDEVMEEAADAVMEEAAEGDLQAQVAAQEAAAAEVDIEDEAPVEEIAEEVAEVAPAQVQQVQQEQYQEQYQQGYQQQQQYQGFY